MTDTEPYATKIMPGCRYHVGDRDVEDRGVSLGPGREHVHRNYHRRKEIAAKPGRADVVEIAATHAKC